MPLCLFILIAYINVIKQYINFPQLLFYDDDDDDDDDNDDDDDYDDDDDDNDDDNDYDDDNDNGDNNNNNFSYSCSRLHIVYVCINSSTIIDHLRTDNGLHGHVIQVRIPLSKTNQFRKYFSFRIEPLWNSLNAGILKVNSFSMFKETNIGK